MPLRTDDDDWGITESVGESALWTATHRAIESERVDALFRDPYAARLVRAAGAPAWTELIGPGFAARCPDLLGAVAKAGQFGVARTVRIDKYLAAAVDDGIRQVVIVATGLDARAYRLQWPSDTTLFELDQPKMLRFKAKELADVVPTVNRREIPVDLRGPWPTALRETGFDPAVAAVWLVEGLLPYLPAEAQNQFFENIAGLSASGSRVGVVTWPGTPPAWTAELRQTRARILAELGIDIDFSDLWYPDDGRTDPAAWFAGQGWLVSKPNLDTVLTARGRAAPEAAAHISHRQVMVTATRP